MGDKLLGPHSFPRDLRQWNVVVLHAFVKCCFVFLRNPCPTKQAERWGRASQDLEWTTGPRKRSAVTAVVPYYASASIYLAKQVGLGVCNPPSRHAQIFNVYCWSSVRQTFEKDGNSENVNFFSMIYNSLVFFNTWQALVYLGIVRWHVSQTWGFRKSSNFSR